MTREELNAQVMVIPFVELEPHVQRGAVLVIDDDLDIAEVGLLLANDDREAVEKLIEDRDLIRATGADVEFWRRDKRFFKILILQPFVIAQNYAHLSRPSSQA